MELMTALVASEQMTAASQAITNAFYSLDYSILEFYHRLYETTLGRILYPILYAITLTGWKGACLILAAIVLAIIPKTRRTGICCCLAIAIGALFTNVLIKNLVARPRPYNFDLVLRQWWEAAGSHMESDKSFPSGHMTVACDFMCAFILSQGKKWLIPGAVYVTLMGVSRNFLIVHYPSDVVFGFIFGVCAGIAAYFVTKAIYARWGDSKLLRVYEGKH